ncbi:MAG: YndM family protein [Bacillaceae bacterium]|nr:YndM family protein [Bacillaceae bacterium]
MDHIKALAIKFVIGFIAIYLTLGLAFGISFANVVLISFITGVVAYVVGDLFILRRSSNTGATIMDFILAFFTIWVLEILFVDPAFAPVVTSSMVAATVISIGEIYYHRYLVNHHQYFKDEENADNRRTSLQESYSLETAEEPYPDLDDNEKTE